MFYCFLLYITKEIVHIYSIASCTISIIGGKTKSARITSDASSRHEKSDETLADFIPSLSLE